MVENFDVLCGIEYDTASFPEENFSNNVLHNKRIFKRILEEDCRWLIVRPALALNRPLNTLSFRKGRQASSLGSARPCCLITRSLGGCALKSPSFLPQRYKESTNFAIKIDVWAIFVDVWGHGGESHHKHPAHRKERKNKP